jgi:hypothetical protein
MKMLADDQDHFRQCHERWKKNIHRDLNASNKPDIWCDQECAQCAFYVRLGGKFAYDYGVCSNKQSPHDGQLMFEHDGCEHFVLAEEDDSPSIKA